MAKFKVISATMVNGQSVKEGTELELDERNKDDLNTMGLLYHANRIRMMEPDEKTSSRSTTR